MTKLTPYLLIALAPLAATAPAAPIPDELKARVLYFPTKVGTKWVYDCGRGAVETVVVTQVEAVGRERRVTRAGADGTTATFPEVYVSPAGLWQFGDWFTGGPEVPWLLKAPYRAGDSWPVPAEGGGGRRTVFGPEGVDVPAGRFMAARVVHDHPDGSRVTSWYAPGVGEVKRAERPANGTEVTTRALRAFTSGKQ